MRVLHLGAGNLFGGIETSLVAMATARTLCPEMQPSFGLGYKGRLSQTLQTAGVPVHILGPVRFRYPWSLWQARQRLRRLLENETFEAILCHECWPHALFAPGIRRRGQRLIFWAHGPHDGRHWLEKLARRTPPDLVLANSQWTASHQHALFPDAPSKVVYLPRIARAPKDRAQVRQDVRAALKTAAETVVVLQVSRFEPLKGHSLLIQALGRLRSQNPWECWIVGGVQRPQEARYLDHLQTLVKELKLDSRIRFLGERTDVPSLMAATDLYCQPNTGPESFGLSFLEALDAELPVVTAAHGGALEIVDTTCGILVPPGKVEPLVEALRSLFENPQRRETLGSAGPARAHHLCDPQTRLQQLAQVLFRDGACSDRNSFNGNEALQSSSDLLRDS